jgi:hypothetical protein
MDVPLDNFVAGLITPECGSMTMQLRCNCDATTMLLLNEIYPR